MEILYSCLVAIVLLPCAALAKVEPAVHQGVRYVVPNDHSRRAYIVATDVQTDKKLWDVTVLENRIDPNLEGDVQYVYIKSMKLLEDTLIVTSERGKTYRIDLKTKKVTPAGKP